MPDPTPNDITTNLTRPSSLIPLGALVLVSAAVALALGYTVLRTVIYSEQTHGMPSLAPSPALGLLQCGDTTLLTSSQSTGRATLCFTTPTAGAIKPGSTSDH